MVDGIGHVTDAFGKRFPGSQGEKDAQGYFKTELEKICDTVTSETFELHPNSFMDWIYITATLLILSLATYFFAPIISIILVVLAFIPMISQLILYKSWFDPLYAKKESVNVYGVIKPKGEVKRRIIVNGHADATEEWFWLYKFGMKGMVTVFIGSLVGALYVIVISFISLDLRNRSGSEFGLFGPIPSTLPLVLGLVGLIFLVLWVALYKFHNKKVVVDGANDNLTACYVSLAVPKALKEAGIQLQNTELCVLISGAEEAGLRGAKAFAKAHNAELTDKEIPTVVVCMETLRETEHFCLYTKDINGIVKNDLDAAALVREAGRKNNIELPYATVTLGATDAAAFSQAGIKATCLSGVNHNLQSYYHTREDTKDNLSPETIGKAFDIIADTVLLYDEKGL
jgi:hypothetical protein